MTDHIQKHADDQAHAPVVDHSSRCRGLGSIIVSDDALEQLAAANLPLQDLLKRHTDLFVEEFRTAWVGREHDIRYHTSPVISQFLLLINNGAGGLCRVVTCTDRCCTTIIIEPR